MRLPKTGSTIRVVNPIKFDTHFSSLNYSESGLEIPVGTIGVVAWTHKQDQRINVKFEAGNFTFHPESGSLVLPDGRELNPLEQFHYFCEIM